MIYVYVAALILGGVVLVSSLLAGDEGDASDIDVGGAAGVIWALRSVRFWTFFLAFFGLTGLVLDGLDLVGARMSALALAGSVGLVTGAGAAGVTRWLSRDETGTAATSDDYIGKTARVLVPVEAGGTGKVRVELRGSTVDVLAKTDEPKPFGAGDLAMIVEMKDTVARIARVDGMALDHASAG